MVRHRSGPVFHLFFMEQLRNKRILLGITGGIAAYKAAELTRLFVKAGCEVKVVMTPAAREFITPLTLQALSGQPVHTELLDPAAEAGMGHIELARWADLMLIAPATADFLARMNAGRGDDLLTAICLARSGPVAVAPAMNQAMWADPATQANIESLRSRHIQIWGPASGEQACGDIGPGRMLEPLELLDLAASQFRSDILTGKHVVITAGPTQEAIDPVRYLSNRSSGKMGYSLAEAAIEAGARVTLISGPVHLALPDRVQCRRVTTAREMLQATLEVIDSADIFIATAAVADYRPATTAGQKIKKDNQNLTLELERTEDILASVAQHSNRPFTVGFAAETRDVINYARDKLINKKLDAIVANDVSRSDIGFNADNNAVTLLWQDGQAELAFASKSRIARQLIEKLAQLAFPNT